VVITPPIHVGTCATAGPSKSLWPVLVHFLLVTIEFGFEFSAEIIRFLLKTTSPARSFLLAGPGDEFQPSFMVASVLALAVFVMPLGAGFIAGLLVSRPVRLLTGASFERKM